MPLLCLALCQVFKTHAASNLELPVLQRAYHRKVLFHGRLESLEIPRGPKCSLLKSECSEWVLYTTKPKQQLWDKMDDKPEENVILLSLHGLGAWVHSRGSPEKDLLRAEILSDMLILISHKIDFKMPIYHFPVARVILFSISHTTFLVLRYLES